MVVKIISIFYICSVVFISLDTNELTPIQPSIHALVAKITHASLAQKRLLLDTIKVQSRMSQKKIRHQVMIEHGVKFD